MRQLIDMIYQGVDVQALMKKQEEFYTGPAMSYGGWVNNWTTNKVGPDSTIHHPNEEENNRKFQEFISSEIKIGLQAVVQDVFENNDPRFRKRVDLARVMRPEGVLLTKLSDIAWQLGNDAGELFNTSTDNPAYLGQRTNPLPGTALLMATPESKAAMARMCELFNDLIDDLIKRPRIGIVFPPPAKKHVIEARLKKEKSDGRGFNPSAYYNDGKIIMGYNGNKINEDSGGCNYSFKLRDMLHYCSAELGKLLITFCKSLAEFYGCPYDAIAKWALLLIRYMLGRGFRVHLDGIAGFGNYPGIVSNTNISREPHPKLFDLIDLQSPEQEAYRTVIPHGGTHVFSGYARLCCAHGVPDKLPGGQMLQQTTLGIKCSKLDLEYKHEWVTEVSLTIISTPFGEPVQSIDIEKWFKAMQKPTTPAAHPAERTAQKPAKGKRAPQATRVKPLAITDGQPS